MSVDIIIIGDEFRFELKGSVADYSNRSSEIDVLDFYDYDLLFFSDTRETILSNAFESLDPETILIPIS
jgi:hypothetical protein